MTSRRWRVLAIGLTVSIAFGFSLSFIVRQVYQTGHDPWDDTGYMLASIEGVKSAGLGALYSDVFSQYGPVHAAAWLAFFSIPGLQICQNHAGVGVAVLWVGTALLAGLFIQRVTLNWLLAALVICIAPAVYPMQAELAHPKTLTGFLTLLILYGSTFVFGQSKSRLWDLLWVALPLSALLLTKINLGGLASLAFPTAALLGLISQTKILRMVAAVLATVPALVLVNDSWPMDSRIALLTACLLPILLLFLTAEPGVNPSERSANMRVLIKLGASTVLVLAVACGVLWIAGLPMSALLEGVVMRPLSGVGGFKLPLSVAVSDFWILGLAGVLGIASLTLRDSRVWDVLQVLISITVVLGSFGQFHVTTVSLVWLLALPAPSSGKSGGASQLFAKSLLVAMTAWQCLGAFPVAGAQVYLPRLLLVIAMLWTTFDSIRSLRIHWPSAFRSLVGVSAVALILAGTGWYRRDGEERERRDRVHVETTLHQANWFRWRASQVGVFECLTTNVRRLPGPVFTHHGQHSFNRWIDRTPPTWLNCTHQSALLRPQELERLLSRFEQSDFGPALIYNQGMGFGKGASANKIQSWIDQYTESWFKTGEYEVRRRRGLPELPPVHCILRGDAVITLRVAKGTAELASKLKFFSQARRSSMVECSSLIFEDLSGAPGYVEATLPKSSWPNQMDRLNPDEFTAVLFDQGGKALASLPVVEVQ